MAVEKAAVVRFINMMIYTYLDLIRNKGKNQSY